MKVNKPERKTKKYRWSAKKCIKNLSILLAVIAFGILLIATAVKATLDQSHGQVAVIKVLRGDTLWSIARRLEPGSDPRLVISKIKQQNLLHSSSLIAGQQLEYRLDK